MRKHMFRIILLAVVVVGVAATTLLWDSEETECNAGCLTCVSSIDCEASFPPGQTCNAAQGCTCRFIQGCGTICSNQ